MSGISHCTRRILGSLEIITSVSFNVIPTIIGIVPFRCIVQHVYIPRRRGCPNSVLRRSGLKLKGHRTLQFKSDPMANIGSEINWCALFSNPWIGKSVHLYISDTQ